MGLVDYDSSSSDDDNAEPVAKKRKTSDNTLPPLPSNFRDLYSSTVRTSTQDDPSLHGGRKRVTPHVVGNWPAHVYLEWTPESEQQGFLSDLISSIQYIKTTPAGKTKSEKNEIHTLLENDLGVQLPLHISLSRPLALKTAQKDVFLSDLTSAIKMTSVRSFEVSPNTLTWHPNEDRTRWFLVLSLQRPENDELRSLLAVSNKLAGDYDQPLLYQASSKGVVKDEKFHLSLAWSLVPQEGDVEIPSKLADRLKEMKIDFEEVKVRIGQDVTSIALRKRRGGMLSGAS